MCVIIKLERFTFWALVAIMWMDGVNVCVISMTDLEP